MHVNKRKLNKWKKGVECYKIRKKWLLMKRYHPVIAIILGNIITGFLGGFVIILPISLLSHILVIFIFVLGGFSATYLSRTNKATIGFYNSLLYSISSLIGAIFIFKTGLTPNKVLILFIYFPILGLIGGFIAKTLRSRRGNEN
ncbi:putative protein [Methanobacterium congolense]|uniref:TIGR04086 family membrane protein n=2 Tax=Methanobacterium congolense TaxID=118062 RepID=A0A1D3L0J7_9EURY|nr:putative protein [Methanobacterium congolense]